MDDKKESKTTFVKSLIINKGNISAACRAINISRQTYYRWIEDDKQFSIDIDNANEEFKDLAESALQKLIREGNPTAIIFFLKTKAEDRGYAEKRNVDLNIKQASTLIIEQVDEESPDDTD